MGTDKNNNSLFTPVVLVAIGGFWLLSNLGLLPNIDWGNILRLWPLLLIFWGFNLIFRSLPSPFGNLLSALLGVIAVGTFVSIVLFGDNIPLLARPDVPIVSNEPVSVPIDGIKTADVHIETSLVSAEIFALSDPDMMLDGQISYVGDLVLENKLDSDGQAMITLDTKLQNGWFLDPSNWNQFDADDKWEIGLNPNVPLDLEIDAASGGADLALGQLQLNRFKLNGGSGVLEIMLPDGTYDANIDLGSGASTWVLPASGGGKYDIDSASGAVMLRIPQGMETQIKISTGSGAFSADSRFTRVRGDDDEGTWETAGFDSAENRLELRIDSGSGSVQVELPSGR